MRRGVQLKVPHHDIDDAAHLAVRLWQCAPGSALDYQAQQNPYVCARLDVLLNEFVMTTDG